MKLSNVILAWSVAAALLATPAAAQDGLTLRAAVAQALDTNPTLAASRSRLAATSEALPQARAAVLPSVSLSGSATRTERSNDGGAVATSSTSEPWSASASASQLVFASGQVAASVRQARARIAGAQADVRSDEQALILDVVTAYAQVIEARAAVDARTRARDNLEELRKFAQAQFEAGVSTRTDLAQAEARLAQARTQLIQAQGDLAARTETFRRLVGAPPVTLAAPAAAKDVPPELDAALSAAVSESPVLIGARANEQAADASVSAARAAFGPRLSLEAGASLSGDGRVDALGQTDQNSVGVRLTVPIFSGGLTASRVREQKAQRAAAGLDRVAAERQVRESVTTAFTALQTARASLASAREQVTAAELAYRGVRLEQETGLRTTVEALDQELDLLTARLTLAAAEREATIAERRLLSAIGALTLDTAAP
ncbi:MAG: TolC family outer membrane protein [Alphaproteobacteria bacterium]|nr:TolC family outer membrane protein [Alphaproteobacteria bacterium]